MLMEPFELSLALTISNCELVTDRRSCLGIAYTACLLSGGQSNPKTLIDILLSIARPARTMRGLMGEGIMSLPNTPGGIIMIV